VINVDGLDSDSLYDDGACMDFYSDDFMEFDEYSYLQSHFDNVDIPPGVEAPIPWLPNSDNNAKKTANGTNSFNTSNQMQSNGGGSWSLKPAHASKKLSSGSGSSFHNPMDSVSHASGVNLSSPWSFPQAAQSKKEKSISQHGRSALNFPPFQSKKKPATSNSSTDYGYAKHLGDVMLPHGVGPAHLGHTSLAPEFCPTPPHLWEDCIIFLLLALPCLRLCRNSKIHLITIQVIQIFMIRSMLYISLLKKRLLEL
jgi:ubiquitin-conjugating enzyme E2 O